MSTILSNYVRVSQILSVIIFARRGGYGIRPYGGDFNNSVNMVWHNDTFMQLNIVEIIRYFVPDTMEHHPRVIQYHFTVFNIT